MNDIEKAIEHYQYGIDHDIFNAEVSQHAQLAITALRAQLARESPQPCEYCNRKRDIEGWFSIKGDTLIGQDNYGCTIYADIDYCPMCGRTLTSNPPKEVRG